MSFFSNNNIKKISRIGYKSFAADAKFVLALSLSFCLIYGYFEPLAAGAASVNDSITVTQVVSSEIAISSPANVSMSSPIPGITGNPGVPRTGSATWTVTTNNTAGFNLALKSNTNPSMQLDATYNFSDYSPATAGTPDFAWSSPAAGAAEFGFTIEPETTADTAAKFMDNAASCNIGTANAANRCWYNMATTDVTAVTRTTNTDSTGEDEIVRFQTESNAKYLKEGNYVATITATATEN